MEIHIDPNIAEIGPLLLTWHGVFTAIGVLVGVWLAARLASKRGLQGDDIYTIALYCVVGGIVGARLLFVFEHWAFFSVNPAAIFAVYEGGISIWGAVLGGVAGGWVGTRIHKLPFGAMADVAAGPFILGQGIGRIGDVINGEHHGRPTDLPIGVVYTHPNTLGVPGEQVHLAVGYEMIWDLIAAFILIKALDRSLPNGMVFLGYVVLYSLGRFITTFFRMDSPPWLFGLPAPIVISVAAILVAVPWMLILRNRANRRESRQVLRARARRARMEG